MSDWQRFQDRVAELEPLLGRAGFRIETPGRLPDKDTGQLREIDVLIRVPYTTRELLVMLECRRRAKVPDVTWIEQLAAKRDSVGANHVIAVSSSGFTEPAKAKAAQYGIELRTLAEVSAESLLEDVYTLTVIFLKKCSANVSIWLDSGPWWDDEVARDPQAFAGLDRRTAPPPAVPDEAKEAMNDVWVRKLFDDRTGATVSAADLCMSEFNKFFEGLFPGAPPLHRTAVVEIPGHPPAVRIHSDPVWYIAAMHLEADVWVEEVNIRPTGSFRYEGESGVLIKRLEFDLGQVDDEGILSLDMLPPNPDGTMPCLPRVAQRSPDLPSIKLRHMPPGSDETSPHYPSL